MRQYVGCVFNIRCHNNSSKSLTDSQSPAEAATFVLNQKNPTQETPTDPKSPEPITENLKGQ